MLKICSATFTPPQLVRGRSLSLSDAKQKASLAAALEAVTSTRSLDRAPDQATPIATPSASAKTSRHTRSISTAKKSFSAPALPTLTEVEGEDGSAKT